MSDARLLESSGPLVVESASYRQLEGLPPALASYSDDFTYTNGALTTVGSAKWVSWGSYASPQVASNILTAGGAEVAAKYNATFSANQYSQADFASMGGGAYPGVLTRISGTNNCIRLGCGNTSTLELYKQVGGVWTFVVDINVGTIGTVRLESVGQTHSIYNNGALARRFWIEDAVLASGVPGVYIWSGGGTLDNWAGGELNFFSLPASDDFNRADTTHDTTYGMGLGTNWYTPELVISSNAAARKTTGDDFARYLLDTGSNDHWVEADVFGQNFGHFVCLNVRQSGGMGGGTSPQCYLAFITGTTYEIGRVNATGNYATLATGSAPGFDGKQRLEVSGTTISYYRNGSLVASITDSSVTAGHFVGFNMDYNGTTPTSFYDNFRCGTLPYTP